MYNEVKINRNKLMCLTPDSVTDRGKRTKTKGLSSGGSRDERVMRWYKEHNDEASGG